MNNLLLKGKKEEESQKSSTATDLEEEARINRSEKKVVASQNMTRASERRQNISVLRQADIYESARNRGTVNRINHINDRS